MKNILKSMSKFSFFCYIRPSKSSENVESDFDSKKFLTNHFGSDRIIDCVNRLETKTKSCPISICNELNEMLKLDNMDSWFRFDEIVGWVSKKLPE
jgi:hypothetical protein